MDYTVIDLFSESATLTAELFNEEDSGNPPQGDEKGATKLTEEAAKRLADIISQLITYEVALRKELKNVATKNKDKADSKVKDIENYAKNVKTALQNFVKDAKGGKLDLDKAKETIESLKGNFTTEKFDDLMKEYGVPEDSKKSRKIIENNLEKIQELVKELDDLNSGYSMFEKLKGQAKKILATLKSLDPQWKAAASVATAIAAYSVLVFLTKRVGYTGSVLNFVGVFKFLTGNLSKLSAGKVAIVAALAGLFTAGLVSGGYYGYVVIKRYLENKDLKEEGESK